MGSIAKYDFAISLVVNNVIPILIGPLQWASVNYDHVSRGGGNPAVSIPSHWEQTLTGYRAQGD